LRWSNPNDFDDPFPASSTGSSGNVVECKPTLNQKKNIVRLLDFYEHDLAPKIEGDDPYKIAENTLTRIATISPALATQYRERLQTIRAEIELKANVKLSSIDDSHHLFRPSQKNCKIRQVAIRRRDPIGDEKRFLVSKDLWDRLDPVNQAGLLVHEIAYEHLSKLGEEDSSKARKINAMLFSGKMEGEKFWATIKELRLPIYP
jgi:hypothetical protein